MTSMGELILADFRAKSWHKPKTLEDMAKAIIIPLIDLAPSEMPAVWPEFSTDKDSA